MKLKIELTMDLDNSTFRNPHNDDDVDYIALAHHLNQYFDTLTKNIAYNCSLKGFKLKDMNGNAIGNISVRKM